MNKKFRQNKGFTLVELIIVIAILAVIAAIAAPNLINNIGESRKGADVSNAKIIGEGAVLLIAQKEEFQVVNMNQEALPATKPTTRSTTDLEDQLMYDLVEYMQKIPKPSFKNYSNYLLTINNGKVVVESSNGTPADAIQLYPTYDEANYK